jgi:hypothetical protein
MLLNSQSLILPTPDFTFCVFDGGFDLTLKTSGLKPDGLGARVKGGVVVART